MTNLSMFLKSDQDRASKELDCFDYLMMNAIEHIAKGEFGKAATYHENMARTLHELQTLKNSKLMDDQIEEQKQLEEEQQQRVKMMIDRIEEQKAQANLYKLPVNIYE